MKLNKAKELINLFELGKQINCNLAKTANNYVFGNGNCDSKIMFIGEAPGKQEDKLNKPFVGPSGKRLDYLLNLINLKREDVYITNIVKYRPPENRDPLPNEILIHSPILLKEIEIIKPKLICTLGQYSLTFMLKFLKDKLDDKKIVSKLHGTILKIEINGENIFLLPLYHPAVSLYKNSMLPILENDFVEIKKILEI